MLFAECLISLGIADGESSNPTTLLHLLEGIVTLDFSAAFPPIPHSLSLGSHDSFTSRGYSSRGMQVRRWAGAQVGSCVRQDSAGSRAEPRVRDSAPKILTLWAEGRAERDRVGRLAGKVCISEKPLRLVCGPREEAALLSVGRRSGEKGNKGTKRKEWGVEESNPGEEAIRLL